MMWTILIETCYTRCADFKQFLQSTEPSAPIFSCDGGKTKFVGWLEQYSPEAKALLESAERDSKGNLKDPTVVNSLGWDSSPMVKRPGDPRWFKRHEKEYDEITSPKCPEGADENQLAPVEP